MLPAFKIGIFLENSFIKFSSFLVKPVVPITTLFLSFDAIFKTSKVHFGTVKSIITFVFLNASILFKLGLIPAIFLLTTLFSVNEINLNFLFFLEEFMICWPILPMHPVIVKLIFFIIL